MTLFSALHNMKVAVRDRAQTAADRLSSVGETQDVHEQPETSLYVCQSCQVTYISEELASCPKCGDTVDQTPTASELGYDSGNTRY